MYGSLYFLSWCAQKSQDIKREYLKSVVCMYNLPSVSIAK